jgi:integrase
MFKWAVENELVPPSVHHGLIAVSGLRRGRSAAIESDPVRPVAEGDVEAVLPHLSKQVAAMVKLQMLTGMRPGEVCDMRGCDIDVTGKLWTYKPPAHKNEYRGHDRTVYLGPQAQAVVAPFLKPNLQDHLFSPRDAEATRRAELHEQRETPIKYGNRPGSNRKRRPAVELGAKYTVTSYRRAILRGCEAAFEMPKELLEPRSQKAKAAEAALPAANLARIRKERAAARSAWRAAHSWHPHQLRHTSATRLRKDYGLEASQVILGHKTLAVTELYAEKNVAAAQRIMAEVG